jgi:hypothetical protein
MPKSQIEGLLTSFPKLTNTGTQHTSVETDTVRYVYQPLEEMYMVLITSKRSNILQDIETLHLFAQVVTSVCRGTTLDEREVSRNAFELLSAFDEIVCLGYRENLTLPQVKNILEMESHEEKIQEIIARVQFPPSGNDLTVLRIRSMRRVRRGNGEPDSWRCNAERWRNLDQDRVVGLPQISHPAVNINLSALPHLTLPQPLITIRIKMKPTKSISPVIRAD